MSARRKLGLRGMEPRLATGIIVLLAFLALCAPTDSAAASPPAPPGFFGVDGGVPVTDDFGQMAAGDVGIYRAVFGFRAFKTAPGQAYDWRYSDHLVLESARQGIDLLPILYGSPPWISEDRNATPIHGRTRRREWRELLVALVERYGPTGTFWPQHPLLAPRPLRVWQIWNEPNSITWWGPRPRPREYALLLERSERAIHSADPTARILSAGIVAEPTNANAIPGPAYLRRLFSVRGIGGAADAVAYHPFSPTVRGVGRQLREARRSLRGTPAAKLPIWITEIGWGTEGPREHPLIKSDRGQNRALRQTFELVLRRRVRLGIERTLWYHWRDERDDLCLWCESSGLLDKHSQPKRIFRTFRSIATR